MSASDLFWYHHNPMVCSLHTVRTEQKYKWYSAECFTRNTRGLKVMRGKSHRNLGACRISCITGSGEEFQTGRSSTVLMCTVEMQFFFMYHTCTTCIPPKQIHTLITVRSICFSTGKVGLWQTMYLLHWLRSIRTTKVPKYDINWFSDGKGTFQPCQTVNKDAGLCTFGLITAAFFRGAGDRLRRFLLFWITFSYCTLYNVYSHSRPKLCLILSIHHAMWCRDWNP